MYTEEELQESIEWLESAVKRHEEALSIIILALVDEESLSENAKTEIKDAFQSLYGDQKK